MSKVGRFCPAIAAVLLLACQLGCRETPASPPLTWGAAPGGGVRGQGNTGLDYVGPCPPEHHDAHRYSFRVYALDAWVTLAEGATREQLLDAMEGHVLAHGELTGMYGRQARRRGGDVGPRPAGVARCRLTGYGGGLWRKEWLLKHEGGLLI